jgi:hypothetical protein
MPGDSNYRAQAKYHEKLSKMKKTPKSSKPTLSPALLLQRRQGQRDSCLKWLKTDFERKKNNGILGRLIERRKELIFSRNEFHWDWRGRFRVLVGAQPNRGAALLDMDDEWIRTYMKSNWVRVKDYYDDPSLTDEDFDEKLSDEIERRRKSMATMYEYELFYQFERTLTRNDFIREELMIAVNKFNCIRACKAVKFEIFAAAFHPDKVWKWLKAGRYIGTVNGEPQHDFNVLNMMAGYDSD